MRLVLVSIHALGRRSFSLASAAAWRTKVGMPVRCIEVAAERRDLSGLRAVALVEVSLPMRTATRWAAPVIRCIRNVNPKAHVRAVGPGTSE